MDNPEQLIRKGVHHEGMKEGAVKGFLGGLTWGIVIVALLIFGRICWDGLPVLLKPEFPFIDIAFLTEKTQTLHVFDDAAGTRHSLPATEYYAWVGTHGADAIFNERPTPIPAAASPARSWARRCSPWSASSSRSSSGWRRRST